MDRIRNGEAVSVRGQGFYIEGNKERDDWSFNCTAPGSLEVECDNGHQVSSGELSDANVTEIWTMNSLRQAFEETHYIVHHHPPFTLRIGQHSPGLDTLLNDAGHDCAAFITAWNPMCQALSQEENRSRQQSLLDEINGRGLIVLPGIGQHPNNGWSGEESVLVLGLQLEAARAIATTYEQLAFVWAKKGYSVELIELSSAK